MELSLRLLLFVLFGAILTGSTLGNQSIRSRIPNGDQVPHPCNPEYIWREPGYQNHLGSGPMNAFGVDFAANNMNWDATICEKDSDGDGRANGVELGDPNCTWTPGTQPARVTQLSHPGVCEPLNSTTCRGRTDFVNCGDLCSGLGEEGVVRNRVTLTSTVSVPGQTMSYKCMVFDFPRDNDYHIVALAPHVDNPALLKHIIVFGCDGDNFPESPDSVHNCYMNTQCGTILFHWTLGDSDICIYPEAGIRIGNNTVGFKRGLIELHLNNPGDTAADDMSGVDIFMTPNKRPYDAGIFFFGQTYLNIPPGEEDHVVSGGCSSSCTQAKMIEPIKITAAFNHMHFTGVSGESQYITNERRVNYIAKDKTFYYDYPKYHSFQQPLQVSPGDRLNVVCHYDTTTRNRSFHFGFDTYNDEMCFAFVMYYPKENMALAVCTSFGDLDTCDFENDVIRGCDVAQLDFSSPDSVPEFSAVQEYCKPDICLKECMTLLRRVNRHPCYSGSLKKHLMSRLATTTNQPEKINMQSFWLKMGSCDYEFGTEMTPDMTGAAITPSVYSAVPFSMIALTVFAMLLI